MKTKKLAQTALFAALITVCAWIWVPIADMTFTMQSFGIFLTLLLLGGKWGTASILVYMLLGAVGLPVFSGFRGGAGMLFGATGGYIWGFLACGLCYWLITAISGGKGALFGLIAGLLLCYACGTGWMMVMYLDERSAGSVGALLLRCVVPYIGPDAAKLYLARLLAKRLKRAVS